MVGTGWVPDAEPHPDERRAGWARRPGGALRAGGAGPGRARAGPPRARRALLVPGQRGLARVAHAAGRSAGFRVDDAHGAVGAEQDLDLAVAARDGGGRDAGEADREDAVVERDPESAGDHRRGAGESRRLDLAAVAARVRKTARAGTAIGRPLAPSAPARTVIV